MPLDLLTHLKELCACPGTSGHEGPVRELLRQTWGPLVDESGEDSLGSLWATRRATRPGRARPAGGPARNPRLLLAAHMDTIGLMVTRLEGEFLRVWRLGGIDPRVLPGQIVNVHGTRSGSPPLPGVIAAPPAHLLLKASRDGVVPLGELVVDTGLPAERLGELVQIGDLVSFAQPTYELQGGLLAARGLDNRASVAALTVCLEALQDRACAWDVMAVATVQEEMNVVGARGSAFTLEPDLAVAVDVTFGSDANTREFAYRAQKLESGPALGLGPNIHPGLYAAFKAAAERAEIAYTTEVMPGHSGTDAFGMQIARAGLPTMTVSIPIRNMHTPVEVVALKDISRTGRLLAEFAAGLAADYLDTLSWDV